MALAAAAHSKPAVKRQRVVERQVQVQVQVVMGVCLRQRLQPVRWWWWSLLCAVAAVVGAAAALVWRPPTLRPIRSGVK